MTCYALIRRWLPAVVMMAVIFTFSSLPAGQIPTFGPLDLVVKKGGHAVGYGLLGLSYYRALPPWLSARYRALTAFFMAVLFALSDEYHQSFVEGRTSSLRDVGIDALGAGVALLLAAAYSSNSSSKSTSS